jgi:leucyl-tRNA synthetase
MGWDAFGLPAEQHAVKTGTHPAANTQNNIANFKRQIKALGFSYDWDREIDTTDPAYFRWTQWIFLQLFRKGLAYVDERPSGGARSCAPCSPTRRSSTARARSAASRRAPQPAPVGPADHGLRRPAALRPRGVDWPDSTKRMQAAWIGRSEGAEVVFGLEKPGLGGLKVFTTRPDTLFGCTYMVLAPEHRSSTR